MIKESDLEDVLPLSPLQEGLLFHTLLADHGPDLYVAQFILDVAGDVDAADVRKWCEARLSAYKQPSEIVLLDGGTADLPG
jgi:hypothetical protein